MTSLLRPPRLALRPLESGPPRRRPSTPPLRRPSPSPPPRATTSRRGHRQQADRLPDRHRDPGRLNVFSGDTRNQAVRGIVVRFGNTNTGHAHPGRHHPDRRRVGRRGGFGVTTVNLAGTVGGNVTFTAAPVKGLAATEVVNLEPTAAVGGNVRLDLGDGTTGPPAGRDRPRQPGPSRPPAGPTPSTSPRSADLTVNGSMAFNLGDGNNTVIGDGHARGPRSGDAFAYTGGDRERHVRPGRVRDRPGRPRGRPVHPGTPSGSTPTS